MQHDLETDRLTLEPLHRGHAAELFLLLADPHLYLYVPGEPPANVAALEEQCKRMASPASPPPGDRWLNWVLRAKESGSRIGRVQATIRDDRSAYLAYEIGAPFWRRGFAAEACARLLRALFEDDRVTRVVAEVDTRNAASIRLLERLGFACTARREAADFFKGSWSDEWTYVLTDDSGRTR